MNWGHGGIDKRERISGRELIVGPSDQRFPRHDRDHNFNRASAENTDLAG
jgi:hypothetical protein